MAGIDGLMIRGRAWMQVAADPTIVRRALATSLIVGTVLTLINHGGHILSGLLRVDDILPVSLTFIIPFAVATASSVAATKRSACAGGQPSGIDLPAALRIDAQIHCLAPAMSDDDDHHR